MIITLVHKKKIEKWAKANPAAVQKAADKNAALKRSKNHHHDHGHKHRATQDKRMQAMWAFVTEPHDTLYGQADVLKRDLA